jgi:hypothetical protein
MSIDLALLKIQASGGIFSRGNIQAAIQVD